MANELIKEKIILNENTGHETSQVLLDGDIIVPDVKPDMAVILQTDAKINIDKTEALADRVNFMGRLELGVLYLAKGTEKPVHSIGFTVDVDDFINMEGITKDMWVDLSCEIANIDYKMVNDRKINYRAVLNVNISAEASSAKEVVVHINDIPENQLLKTQLNVNKSVENKFDHFTVKDEIPVPSGKPNIREILQSSISITNKDIRISNGRVSITGELAVSTLYKGDTDASIVELMESELPFSGALDVANAREDMFADVALSVKDQYIRVRADEDGEDRVIEAEVTIGALMKISSQQQLEILEDAYCINKSLVIEKSPVKYPHLICRNRNQANIKEVIQLEGSCPDILQIFRIKGTPYLDDIKIIDDKVIAEGMIDTDILYVAEDDNYPLYSYKAMVPYKQVIETKGAVSGMIAKLDISVDRVSFNILSGKEIEVRIMLLFNTKVLEEKNINVITAIEFDDMGKELIDNMASMTMYVVQKGDSLWKIAKKYNTAIDDILAVNEIENPAKIYPGQKLLILKKLA